VVDDELDRLQRVHLVGVTAQADDPVAHRRQVDDCGNAGEVLQQHARRSERDFFRRLALHIPASERLDIRGFDEPPVLVTKQILEKNFQRERQPGDFGKSSRLERGETVHLIAAPVDVQASPRVEGVHGRHTQVL
jgi:hypothetical protein